MLLAEIDGASLDITGAQIPMEPSYLILNTAGTPTGRIQCSIGQSQCIDGPSLPDIPARFNMGLAILLT